MKLQLTALGFIALAAAAIPGVAHADPVNLVQNGSFSSTSLNGSGQMSGGNVTDWTTTSGYTFLYTPIKNQSSRSTAGVNNNGTGVALYGNSNGYVPVSPDGGNFLAADSAFQVGTLSQTLFGLVTGATYAVTFYQAAGQQTNFDGNTTDTWKVGLGNDFQNAPTQIVKNHGFDNWVQITLDFVATATSEVLSFTATGTPGQSEPPFALLDGVSAYQVSPPPAPVPEPPAYAVMLVALLGMLGLRRLWTRRA